MSENSAEDLRKLLRSADLVKDLNGGSSFDKDLSEIASLLESIDPNLRSAGNNAEKIEVLPFPHFICMHRTHLIFF